MAEGRMMEPGLAALERAKADGSWTRLDASHPLRVSRDLPAVVKGLPRCAAALRRVPASTRRAILE